MGWVGVRENLGDPRHLLPSRPPTLGRSLKKTAQAWALVGGPWTGVRFPENHVYPISLPFALFTCWKQLKISRGTL